LKQERQKAGRKLAEEQMATYARQQAAIAELDQLAFTGGELSALLSTRIRFGHNEWPVICR
jgi:hypothetical protein